METIYLMGKPIQGKEDLRMDEDMNKAVEAEEVEDAVKAEEAEEVEDAVKAEEVKENNVDVIAEIRQSIAALDAKIDAVLDKVSDKVEEVIEEIEGVDENGDNEQGSEDAGDAGEGAGVTVEPVDALPEAGAGAEARDKARRSRYARHFK